MKKTQLVTFVVLTALGAAAAERVARDVLPSGKCNTYHIEPKPIDYDKLVRLGRWNILYVPDAEPFRQLDHAYVHVTPNNDDSYKVVVSKYWIGRPESSQTFRHRYIGNVIAEVSGYETGNYTHQHYYPLALMNDSFALLYRCSEIGRVDLDTRFIISRDGTELSESARRELFEADASFNFRGSLHRLPNILD